MGDGLTSLILGAGGLIASKEVIVKLLGPTAEYVGDGLRDVVKKGAENLGRILDLSCEKLKGDVDCPGRVNPRVFKGVWDEGRFIEDAFAAEYFAGILSSARTAQGDDDSAIPFLAMVKSLSSNQLRLHFLIYYLVARCASSSKLAGTREFWQGLELTIPRAQMLKSMELAGADGLGQLLNAQNGLLDHNLISAKHGLEIGQRRDEAIDLVPDADVIIYPNERGARLFLRALGSRGLHADVITTINVDYRLSGAIKSTLHLPDDTILAHQPTSDRFRELQNDVADRIGEIDSELDELKDRMDKQDREDCDDDDADLDRGSAKQPP